MPMLWPRRNYLQTYAEMSLVNVSCVAENDNGKNVRVMTYYGYCLWCRNFHYVVLLHEVMQILKLICNVFSLRYLRKNNYIYTNNRTRKKCLRLIKVKLAASWVHYQVGRIFLVYFKFLLSLIKYYIINNKINSIIITMTPKQKIIFFFEKNKENSTVKLQSLSLSFSALIFNWILITNNFMITIKDVIKYNKYTKNHLKKWLNVLKLYAKTHLYEKVKNFQKICDIFYE